MHSFKTTALAGAVLLALSGAAVHAAEPSKEVKALKETVEELRKQVQELKKAQRSDVDALEKARLEELRKQVNELRAQLKQPQPDKPADTAASIENESQEAQDARTPATKADVQGLRTDLENYKYDQSRLQERNIPSVTRNTKIGGGVTLRYDTQNPGAQPSSSSSGTGPTEVRNNGFNAPQFTLNFAGNLFRDYTEGRNLTYRLAFTNSNTATSSTATINATDAYIRYSYQPGTGNPEDPLGTVTLGQQTIPFGQDAQALDPEVKAVIGNAGFVSGLGLNTPQVGIQVAGDYEPSDAFTNNSRAPLLSYALGVFNGNGANRADNNDFRDWVGRLVYTLPVDYASWFRQLQIGTSYYRGYTSLGPSSSTDVTLATSKGAYNRTGFDINWTHLPFSVSYEWAYGKQELYNSADNRLSNPDLFKRGIGQYVNFGYTWGEQFLNSSKQQGKFDDWWPKSYQAFLRYDVWDPNASKVTARSSNDDRKRYQTTLGLNIFFAETTKFQINYLHTRYLLENARPSAANPASTNGLQAQFNATF